MSSHWKTLIRHSGLYVLLQTVTAGALVLLAPWRNFGLVNYLGLALGGGVMLWSLGTLRMKQLSVLPEARRDGELITTGPYRFVRHPMYTGLLIATASTLTISTLATLGWGWILLLIVLDLKSRREEKSLLATYPGYAAFRGSRGKFFPGVY